MAPEPTLYSVQGAADRLGLSRQRIHQFIAAGQLPATRFGHMWLIEGKHLTEFQLSRELDIFAVENAK